MKQAFLAITKDLVPIISNNKFVVGIYTTSYGYKSLNINKEVVRNQKMIEIPDNFDKKYLLVMKSESPVLINDSFNDSLFDSVQDLEQELKRYRLIKHKYPNFLINGNYSKDVFISPNKIKNGEVVKELSPYELDEVDCIGNFYKLTAIMSELIKALD